MRSWPGAAAFPIGADVSLDQLDRRSASGAGGAARAEPVSWMPALDCWLVTSHDARAAGDPRCGELHRRRPALLDRSRGRAEHAQPRRRRARAPPGAVRAAVQAAGRPRPVRPTRWPPRRNGCRRARAGGQRRSCGVRSRARSPRTRWYARARAGAAARWQRCWRGTTRSSAPSPRSRQASRVPDTGRRGVRGAARPAARGDPLGRSRASLLGGGRRRHRAERRRDRVQRRGAAVRRDRDDRGDDRQRGRSTCSSARSELARSPRRLDAARRGDRGVAAARACRRGGRPLRDRRRGARRRRDRATGTSCALDRRAPTATPRCSQTPTASTCDRPQRRPASGVRPRAARVRRHAPGAAGGAGPRCDRCCDGLPGLRLDPERPAEHPRAGVPQAARASRDLGDRVPDDG